MAEETLVKPPDKPINAINIDQALLDEIKGMREDLKNGLAQLDSRMEEIYACVALDVIEAEEIIDETGVKKTVDKTTRRTLAELIDELIDISDTSNQALESMYNMSIEASQRLANQLEKPTR